MDARLRRHLKTTLGATAAATVVAGAAIASPTPADAPYVVVAWSAVAVGAAALVAAAGKGEDSPEARSGSRQMADDQADAASIPMASVSTRS
jgi:hypothetical protein